MCRSVHTLARGLAFLFHNPDVRLDGFKIRQGIGIDDASDKGDLVNEAQRLEQIKSFAFWKLGRTTLDGQNRFIRPQRHVHAPELCGLFEKADVFRAQIVKASRDRDTFHKSSG
jgi:hypothetical protein